MVGIGPVTVEWWWDSLTRGLIRGVPIMAGAFVYRNGLNYRNGLPEWTFIYGFECMQRILYAQKGLQTPQRVESTSSMH